MVKFGPSGNSKIFYDAGHKSSIEAPSFLKKIGLTCYEYSFGRGFTIKSETAQKLGEEAEKNGILVSVHAPYYINLANPNPETVEKNASYILKSLDYLKLFKGKKCVVHSGSQTNQTREVALDNLYKQLDIILSKYYLGGYDDVYICPETMGKYQQIG